MSNHPIVHFQYFTIFAVNYIPTKLKKKKKIRHKHLDFQLPLRNQTHRKLDVLSTEQLMTWGGPGCPQWAIHEAELSTVLNSPSSPHCPPAMNLRTITVYHLSDCLALFFPS